MRRSAFIPPRSHHLAAALVGLVLAACMSWTYSMRSAKNCSPASSRISSPADRPSSMCSETGPSLSALKICCPSGEATRPLNLILPSTNLAWPAMGVLHEPSSVARNDRSHSTQILVSLSLSALMYLIVFSSSERTWIPMAPCATAGSISSQSRILVMQSVMSMRLRPASASSVASTTSSSSLRRRVCTLPRKLTHLIPGFLARS
mmetsp:Transcript_35048/g.70054  ORF Transcript_35048/g.70054 Transcript_35048/m.70054 type:complete len:205 (+) Transcript_35048:238-852(+)